MYQYNDRRHSFAESALVTSSRQNAGSSVGRGPDKEKTASVDQGAVPTLKPSDDHIYP
jgi:hypothetical protein